MTLPDFAQWDALLRNASQDRPCLVLDVDRFRGNLTHARERLQHGIRSRVVAKSLSSLPMLDMAVTELDAIGVMSFSAGMVRWLLTERPAWEQLMGKPLPVAAVEHILTDHTNAADTVIWLIDTPERAAQMAEVATKHSRRLRVALEIDIGLHRGGTDIAVMAAQLNALHEEGAFTLEGVMGYEPHLAKLPSVLRRAAERRVADALAQAETILTEIGAGTMVNTGGSLTFSRYGRESGTTEVSLGSVLAKPTDFDIDATTGFEPALFIATPILKYMPRNALPGLDRFRALTALRAPANIAVYGGYWKAKPVHPAGYGYSGIFGRSSNQEVWTGPALDTSPVDHFAFLRPTQSEAVIPEFQDVLLIENGRLSGTWPATATL